MIAEPAARISLRLRWREKWLFAASLGLLVLARMEFSLFGFGSPKEGCAQTADLALAPEALARRVAWNIDRAARFVPAATCLVKARAAQRLLAMKGHGSDIRIGVRGGAEGGFKAHAWLVSGGRIVLGGSESELQQYRQLIGAD